MSISLSPVLFVAASVPMPNRFAFEWSAVVKALLEFEKPRLDAQGYSGVYRLCGTYKQFAVMHAQALGAKGIGVTSLFQRLREIVATCEAGGALAIACPGAYIAVSTNYRFEWIRGGADAASFAFRFAADYSNIGLARAVEFCKDLSGGGPADAETALLLQDPDRGFWNRSDFIDDGYCYEYARLIGGVTSDLGGWSVLPLPDRQFNMFALTVRLHGKKWHVLGPHETVTGLETPLGYVEDGSFVGGSLMSDGANFNFRRYYMASEESSDLMQQTAKDFMVNKQCSPVVVPVGANRVSSPVMLVDFLKSIEEFRIFSSYAYFPRTTGLTLLHGLWTTSAGAVMAFTAQLPMLSVAHDHYINHPVESGYMLFAFIPSTDVGFVNGFEVSAGVAVVHSLDRILAMHVMSRHSAFSYALVLLDAGDHSVEVLSMRALHLVKSVCGAHAPL